MYTYYFYYHAPKLNVGKCCFHLTCSLFHHIVNISCGKLRVFQLTSIANAHFRVTLLAGSILCGWKDYVTWKNLMFSSGIESATFLLPPPSWHQNSNKIQKTCFSTFLSKILVWKWNPLTTERIFSADPTTDKDLQVVHEAIYRRTEYHNLP
jgi:hypothetical protein